MAAEFVMIRDLPPLPHRADDAHKGDFGRIVIIGGCAGEVGMIGAPALAANAAFRGGAGLVQLFIPDEIRNAVAVLAPCATFRTMPSDAAGMLTAISSFQADVIALGPGLGTTIKGETLKAVLSEFPGPVVLDADGLNLLSTIQLFEIPNAKRIVLTPHPGEARRLLAARGINHDIEGNASSRGAAIRGLTAAYGCTCVLKGAATLVSDGKLLFVNQTGNSGMATAGTGDILTGLIAALLGQKMPPLSAAVLGVHLQGLAGDFAAHDLGTWSMTAQDVLDYLPETFQDDESPDDR